MNIKPIMTEGPNGDLSVRGRVFWPYERVEEVFSRMEAARGGPREAEELLVFYRRMKRLYDGFSMESDYFLDGEEALRMAALGVCGGDNGGSKRPGDSGMIVFIWAVLPAAVCAAILLNSRARRRRLIAEIEEEEAKNKLWLKLMENRMLLFQNDMRRLEEQRQSHIAPEPEPPGPRKPAGKKEFTVQNVVNILEPLGLHVERIDEIYPAIDPFRFLERPFPEGAPEPEETREVTAVRLTVSPRGRFIRAKKIRRRHHGF